MNHPNEIVVDGLRYRRVDRVANRVSAHVMYDCHLFRQLEGATIEDLIEDWRKEVNAPDPELGKPFLCPLIVLEDDRELRRVGTMVFGDSPRCADQLADWHAQVNADPDIARILAEGKSESQS